MKPLYVPCPRCRGRRDIAVCTDPGGYYRPSVWEYVGCPTCHQTGEADRQMAADYLRLKRERERA